MLAYDADAAGQAAAERCYQWEQRFEVAVPGRRPARRPRSRRRVAATIPQQLVARGGGRDAVPRVPARPRARAPPTCRRSKAGRAPREDGAVADRRAPERPRARPVRHEARGPARHRARSRARRRRRACATRPHVRAGAASRRRAAGRAGRRPARARRAALGGAGARADERPARRRRCSSIRSRGRRSTRSPSWPWHECLERASTRGRGAAAAARGRGARRSRPDRGARDARRGQPGRGVKSDGCSRRC